MTHIFELLNRIFLKHNYKKLIASFLNSKRHILLLALLSFLPLLWFRRDFAIRAEELGYLNYSFIFEKFLYSWSSHVANGLPISFHNHLMLYPSGLLYKIFDLLRLPEEISQKIILIVFLQITLFSVYKLILSMTSSKNISFVASLFYTFTFYTMSTPFYTAKMLQLILLPILFYISFNYFIFGKLKYLFLNFIILFLTQGVFANLPNAMTTLAIYPISFFYAYFI